MFETQTREASGRWSRQLRALRRVKERVTYARTCEGSVRGERDVNAQLRRDLLGTAPTPAPREARCLAFVRTEGQRRDSVTQASQIAASHLKAPSELARGRPERDQAETKETREIPAEKTGHATGLSGYGPEPRCPP